jgi:hypothetical protein
VPETHLESKGLTNSSQKKGFCMSKIPNLSGTGMRRPSPDNTIDPPSRYEIAALAHELWIERGCPEGSPQEDWLKAEQELGLLPDGRD